MWDVNLAGMARVCRAARPHLQKGASIVNITSVTAWLGRLRGASLYGASKAAMEAFTRYLAYELAPHGIRANALAPGFIEVLPMSESMRFIAHSDTDQGAIDWLLPHIPLGRMGRPGRLPALRGCILHHRARVVGRRRSCCRLTENSRPKGGK